MQIIMTRTEKRRLERIIHKVANGTQIALLLGFFIALFAICCDIERNYKIDAEVVRIEGHTYTVLDKAGECWQFENDKLFPVGTKVTLKINDSCTPNIVDDDEVIKVKPLK